MAVSTGPITLTTSAHLRESHIEKGVMLQFVKAAPILELLKIKNIGKRDYRWARVTQSVNGPAYGAIGMGYSTIQNIPEQMSTTMSYFGFQSDVDKREVNDKDNFEDPRQFNIKLGTEAEAYFLVNELINGNPAVQKLITVPGGTKQIPVNQLPGVKYALDTTSVSGLISNKIDCGGVDISAANNSPTNSRKFARFIDQAVQRVGDGMGTNVAMLVPIEVAAAIPDIARQGGMFKTVTDSFGRAVTTWGDTGMRIINAGIKSPSPTPWDTSTSANRVIGWETSAGVRDDSSNFSSVYLVDFSQDSVLGVEQYGMSVFDAGLLQSDGVTYRTIVDWSLGLSYQSPRAACRLFDIAVK